VCDVLRGYTKGKGKGKGKGKKAVDVLGLVGGLEKWVGGRVDGEGRGDREGKFGRGRGRSGKGEGEGEMREVC